MKKLTTVLALSLLAASALADDKQEPLGPVGEAPGRATTSPRSRASWRCSASTAGCSTISADRTRSRRTWSRRRHRTRRWFYLVRPRAITIALVPRMEAIAFTRCRGARSSIDLARARRGLKELLKNRRRVAMEYSPGGELPWFPHVDAAPSSRCGQTASRYDRRPTKHTASRLPAPARRCRHRRAKTTAARRRRVLHGPRGGGS